MNADEKKNHCLLHLTVTRSEFLSHSWFDLSYAEIPECGTSVRQCLHYTDSSTCTPTLLHWYL